MGADETNPVEEDIQPTTTDQRMYATPDEAGLSGPLATVEQFAQAPSVRHPLSPSHAHNN